MRLSSISIYISTTSSTLIRKLQFDRTRAAAQAGPLILQKRCFESSALLGKIQGPRKVVPQQILWSHSQYSQSRLKKSTNFLMLDQPRALNHDAVKTEELVSKKLIEKEDIASSSQETEKELSTGQRLKLAVRDYGGVVLVFHITMSLCSLGTSYVIVSSGINIVEVLKWIGLSEDFLQSKITTGGSTFVLAYAFHKVFAPVRLGITLTAVPFIVKKLRAIGFLKKPL